MLLGDKQLLLPVWRPYANSISRATAEMEVSFVQSPSSRFRVVLQITKILYCFKYLTPCSSNTKVVSSQQIAGSSILERIQTLSEAPTTIDSEH